MNQPEHGPVILTTVIVPDSPSVTPPAETAPAGELVETIAEAMATGAAIQQAANAQAQEEVRQEETPPGWALTILSRLDSLEASQQRTQQTAEAAAELSAVAAVAATESAEDQDDPENQTGTAEPVAVNREPEPVAAPEPKRTAGGVKRFLRSLRVV